MTTLQLASSQLTPIPAKRVRTRVGRLLQAVPVAVFGLYVLVGAFGPFVVDYSHVRGDLEALHAMRHRLIARFGTHSLRAAGPTA